MTIEFLPMQNEAFLYFQTKAVIECTLEKLADTIPASQADFIFVVHKGQFSFWTSWPSNIHLVWI